MKAKAKGILFALFMICALTAMAGSKGEARFASTTVDMGTISEKGGPKTATFTFTNIGDGNIIITDASAQCGCTRPQYSDAPVAPGKKGTIKVTYNPKGRPGSFMKSVTVRMAGAKKGKIVLKIKGTVKS